MENEFGSDREEILVEVKGSFLPGVDNLFNLTNADAIADGAMALEKAFEKSECPDIKY